MSTSAIRAGERFTDEETSHLMARFQREGFYDFGPVLEEDEVDAFSFTELSKSSTIDFG